MENSIFEKVKESGKQIWTRVYRYFRLRRELSLTILSFFLLLLVVYGVHWTEHEEKEDFMELRKFEMVDLKMPQQQKQEDRETRSVNEMYQPIETKKKEEKKEEKEEKKKKPPKPTFQFGDDSGEYTPSAMAATPPKAKSPLPAYPKAMQKAGIEGVVVLEVGIDAEGNVKYGKIVKGVHRSLDELVITWIKKVKFYPARDGEGNPFAVKIYWPIRFKLTD